MVCSRVASRRGCVPSNVTLTSSACCAHVSEVGGPLFRRAISATTSAGCLLARAKTTAIAAEGTSDFSFILSALANTNAIVAEETSDLSYVRSILTPSHELRGTGGEERAL